MSLPKKLLIATDFSEGAERAGGVAMALAARFGAELHWVHGIGHLPAGTTPSGLPLLTRYVEQARHAAVEKLGASVARARDSGLNSEGHIVDAPAADGVADLARQIGADCLVVGSHGHSALRRIWLGSVAERIVRQAACRVLIVRGEGAPAAHETIVLGDDLTPFSTAARKAAIDWARCLGGRLEVVHSIDLGIPYLSSVEVVVPSTFLDQAYTDALSRLAGDSKNAGDLQIADHVVSEKPVAALCEHAERRDAGLIIVGTHSRHGLDRLLLGSVAEGVARRAPCSVLVVPSTAAHSKHAP